jgi:hypothetical protein
MATADTDQAVCPFRGAHRVESSDPKPRISARKSRPIIKVAIPGAGWPAPYPTRNTIYVTASSEPCPDNIATAIRDLLAHR